MLKSVIVIPARNLPREQIEKRQRELLKMKENIERKLREMEEAEQHEQDETSASVAD